MKKSIATLLTTSALVLAANPSFAECTLQAIQGSPEIPALEQTNYEEVAALRSEMAEYVASATEKLERCQTVSGSFEYFAAVVRLEQKAERFNELARYFNSQEAIAFQ